jgi:hypothetical protein
MHIGAIGVYQDRNFAHIDIRSNLSPISWINENGLYSYGVDFTKEMQKGYRP